MHLITTLLAAACALSGALASPVTEPAMMVEVAASAERPSKPWFMRSLTRKCDKEDTVCDWSFSIDSAGMEKMQSCKRKVTTEKPHKASQQEVQPFNCGPFQVSFNWSGQFGPGKGFVTFAVVLKKVVKENGQDKEIRLIIWPSYTDATLATGQPAPDKGYMPVPI